MLKNFLKTSWRNLLRHKTYSSINILGLSVGLAVCMIIISYVSHEMSYDSFHKNADRIFWVQSLFKGEGDTVYSPMTSFATGPVLKMNNTEIKDFVRVGPLLGSVKLKTTAAGARQSPEPGFLFADSNFFSFFSFPLYSGNPGDALKDPSSVVLSKKAAEKYFGRADPVGQILVINNTQQLRVSAVAGDIPSNSSIQFDFLAPVAILNTLDSQRIKYESTRLQGGSFSTYLKLSAPDAAGNLNKQLDGFKQADNNGLQAYHAIPISNTHLNETVKGENNVKYLRIFLVIAAMTLLLAISNYVSMATARSISRAKEIGVRKVLGAKGKDIAAQFFIESALYCIISFGLALLITLFIQSPVFRLLKINQPFSFLFSPFMLVRFTLLLLLTIIVTAIYPSAILAAYKPVAALSRKIGKPNNGFSIRQVFAVFQFSISIVLIVCGIAVSRQLNFIRHYDTGIKSANSIVVPFSPEIGKHYISFEHDIASLNMFDYISAARYPLFKAYDTYFLPVKNSDKQLSTAMLPVDESFIGMMGLKWSVAPADDVYLTQKNTVLLNQTAARQLNLGEQPIGQSIQVGNRQLIVRGVLKDFNFESLKNSIGPLALTISPQQEGNSAWSFEGGYFFGALKKGINPSVINAKLTAIYNKYDKENAFEFSYTDDVFADLYQNEDRLEKLAIIAMIVTLVIACFGLYGLAIFIIQQRHQEIGIRKVMGAGAGNIFLLLSSDFMKIILAAGILASPVAWWAMHQWLQSFPYRIAIEFWMFGIALVAAFVITMLTIGYQVTKAAMTRAVRILKSE